MTIDFAEEFLNRIEIGSRAARATTCWRCRAAPSRT